MKSLLALVGRRQGKTTYMAFQLDLVTTFNLRRLLDGLLDEGKISPDCFVVVSDCREQGREVIFCIPADCDPDQTVNLIVEEVARRLSIQLTQAVMTQPDYDLHTRFVRWARGGSGEN